METETEPDENIVRMSIRLIVMLDRRIISVLGADHKTDLF